MLQNQNQNQNPQIFFYCVTKMYCVNYMYK